MPWVEFTMYIEYMGYLQDWGHKEGIARNKKLDAKDKAKYGGGYKDGGIKNLKQKIKIQQQNLN